MARMGLTNASVLSAISMTPMSGMRVQVHAAEMPATAKYGSHAALVIMPKAPWPMNSAATARRKIQWSVVASADPRRAPVSKDGLGAPAIQVVSEVHDGLQNMGYFTSTKAW